MRVVNEDPPSVREESLVVSHAAVAISEPKWSEEVSQLEPFGALKAVQPSLEILQLAVAVTHRSEDADVAALQQSSTARYSWKSKCRCRSPVST